jgi:hypothetical protein
MSDLFSFNTTRNGVDYGITARLDPDTFAAKLTVFLDVRSGGQETLTLEVDPTTRQIQVLGLQGLSSHLLCLAACGIGAVMGPLVSCYDTDLSKYKACLKAKGMDMLGDAVKCALGCAAAAAGP